MTDLPSVVPLLRQNIQINNKSNVDAMDLFWGNNQHLDQVMARMDYNIDFVFGSDVVFDFENFAGMVEILNVLVAKCGLKVIVFGFTHRFKDVEKWF